MEVWASPEELRRFVTDGYLVRESLLPEAEIRRLRDALDAVRAVDQNPELGGGTFTGTFLRHLADKHPAFLELVDFAPLTSVARALYGPAVTFRGLTARIVSPDDPNQEVEWHFHQRVIPDPIPPLFQAPQTLDCLIYLDDTTDIRNGPLVVQPGSHRWLDRDLDQKDTSDSPGQKIVGVPAGSAVLTHGNLWHRALPTLPGGSARRVLILGYCPAWQKSSVYGKKPENGLMTQLLASGEASEEMKELLGVGGYI